MTLTRLLSATLFVSFGFVFAASAKAQLPQTRLYSISPSGGARGSVVEVRLTSGADLEEIDRVVFTDGALKAEPKVDANSGEPVANTFLVTIPADAPLGVHELRCGGLWGLSNPRRFVVSDRKEVVEAEANNTVEQAMPLEVGAVVNGKMDGGADLDWFRFSGTAGQKLVFDVWAERIDSRMDAELTVFTADQGRRLAYARNTRGRDPVLIFDVPADGDYLLKLHDKTYRNGNEYVYRLEAHADPYVMITSPVAGQAGTTGTFRVYGVNLPGGTPTEELYQGVPLEVAEVKIAVPDAPDVADVDNRIAADEATADVFAWRFDGGEHPSNPVRIGWSPVPVVTEQDASIEAPQQVTLPVSISGTFGEIAEEDHYRFEAKKGELVSVTVFGQRLGLDTDPYLIVEQVTVADDGKETIKRLTAIDDTTANPLQNVFETQHDDATFLLNPPADGLYQVRLYDRYREVRGGTTLAYWLQIRPATPDFRLLAVPAAPQAGTTWPVGLRKGDTFGITILAHREDGFDGPINLRVDGLPQGMRCAGGSVGTKETTSLLVIESTAEAPADWSRIRIIGEAETGAGTVTHEARIGSVAWSTAGNVPAIARLTNGLTVSVMDEVAPFQIQTDLTRIDVCQNRQILLPVRIEKRTGFDEKVTLKVTGLPKGANIDAKDDAIDKGQTDRLLRLFVKENSPPGVYTLWLASQGQVSYSRNPEKTKRLEEEAAAKNAALEAAQKSLTEATQAKTTAAKEIDEATKLVATHTQEVTQATQAKAAAEKMVADLTKTVADQQKQAEEAQAQITTVQTSLDEARKKLEAAPEDADLKTQVAETEKMLTAAQEAHKQATDAFAKTQQQLTDAQGKVAAEAKKLETATAAKQAAETKKAAAEEAQAKATTAEQQGQAAVKAADAAKKAADKAAADAKKASAPKNINFTPPSSPLVIVVHPAPIKLTAEVPNGGKVKRGEALDVKVKITRNGDFAGPVKLTLPLPPGIAGLSANEAVVAADATEATVTISASGEATEGAIGNLVIRGIAEMEGESAVDVPITLNVGS